jgi:hypothetical protein
MAISTSDRFMTAGMNTLLRNIELPNATDDTEVVLLRDSSRPASARGVNSV